MALSKIDAVNFLTGTIPSGNIATSSLAAAATGKVLQVVETRLTAATASTTSGTFAAVSGLTASITPSATSSKILIFFCATLISGNHAYMNLSRDGGSSYVGSGVAVSSRPAATFYAYADGNTSRPQSATILDSPSTTSAITYQAYWRTNSSTAYLNRTYNDVDGGYGGRGVSSITLLEIAG